MNCLPFNGCCRICWVQRSLPKAALWMMDSDVYGPGWFWLELRRKNPWSRGTASFSDTRETEGHMQCTFFLAWFHFLSVPDDNADSVRPSRSNTAQAQVLSEVVASMILVRSSPEYPSCRWVSFSYLPNSPFRTRQRYHWAALPQRALVIKRYLLFNLLSAIFWDTQVKPWQMFWTTSPHYPVRNGSTPHLREFFKEKIQCPQERKSLADQSNPHISNSPRDKNLWQRPNAQVFVV